MLGELFGLKLTWIPSISHKATLIPNSPTVNPLPADFENPPYPGSGRSNWRVVVKCKPCRRIESQEVVDIVNVQLPNTENEDESAEDEGNSEDNDSASVDSTSTHDDKGTEVVVGDRGKGTQGRSGRPRKRTGFSLDLEEAEAETSTPPATSTPVIPTPSLLEGLPTIRMIPTTGSRVQSSETPRTRSQRQTPTQTTTEDDEPPPPEPDPMTWPLVDNHLPEGEEKEEDIDMEEELAWRRSSLDRLVVYSFVGTTETRNSWHKVRKSKGTTKISWVFQNYYKWFVPQFNMAPDQMEFKIYKSWQMRAAKRLHEIMHEIRNKAVLHGWIWDDLFDRLVEI
ncbi:hypothetical protein PIB30_094499 [Stylosanthes scabra]|uniref:Uncharacterized protein n=1 Tax=Stylosanthes scabra TaxID=79078 RepID=A0ABU6TV20_9FABA|nr:hypothetical protein [Stylosanthes scabra]